MDIFSFKYTYYVGITKQLDLIHLIIINKNIFIIRNKQKLNK